MEVKYLCPVDVMCSMMIGIPCICGSHQHLEQWKTERDMSLNILAMDEP
jgi:hypothetical protein